MTLIVARRRRRRPPRDDDDRTTTRDDPADHAATTAATTTAARRPPANATVPDVSGQTEQAAATAFNSAGVLASLFFVPAQDPLGSVVQQAKPAGTTVPYRAHVQINLSKRSR